MNHDCAKTNIVKVTASVERVLCTVCTMKRSRI